MQNMKKNIDLQPIAKSFPEVRVHIILLSRRHIFCIDSAFKLIQMIYVNLTSKAVQQKTFPLPHFCRCKSTVESSAYICQFCIAGMKLNQ